MSTTKPSFQEMERDVNRVLKLDTQVTAEQANKTSQGIKDYLKAPYIFILVPIIVAAALYYLKPSFVLEKDENDELILSYKQLAIYSAGVTAVVVGAYYYYYGKQKPN